MDREACLQLLFQKDAHLLNMDTGRRIKPMKENEPPVSHSQAVIDTAQRQSEPSEIKPAPTAPAKETPVDSSLKPVHPIHHDGTFSPLVAVSRYPYKFIKNDAELSQKVASQFFDGGKFWDRPWDVYYIYPVIAAARPLLLAPTVQVRAFFQEINTALDCTLSIPSEPKQGMQLLFQSPNLPQPIFLGHSTSRKTKDQLESQITSRRSCIPVPPGMDEEFRAFEEMIQNAFDAAKNKKKPSKEKQAARLKTQIYTVECLARVQRYLGLRELEKEPPTVIDGDLTWGGKTYQKAAADTALQSQPEPEPCIVDVHKPAPYTFWKEPVFVCVDVEANERCHKQITEVGISTLDTNDLAGIVPGAEAVNWRSHIQSRHLRVLEYGHHVNRLYLAGCPGRFDFGESEWVAERDLGATVLAHLRASAADRPVVLVGHHTAMDIQYLRQMGVRTDETPAGTAGFIDMVDTADCYRVLKREHEPRSLARLLEAFDMVGWNLHNAGNDARYTLEVMARMVVEHSVDMSVELQRVD